MNILGLDPGETTGLAMLHYTEAAGLYLGQYDQPGLSIVTKGKSKGFDWDEVMFEVSGWVELWKPGVIVLEDYRVYESKASAHIGFRVLTAELIGAICFEASRHTVPVVRVSATKKGRWPKARLTSKFPDYFNATAPHARDAVVLALVYAEQRGYI